MAFHTSGSSGPSAEINVTPLIDVLLVLLIIFMVIVPVTPRGLAALLPQPSRGNPHELPEQPIIVEVRSAAGGQERYGLNRQPVNRADLPQALAHLLADRQQKVMFLRGDRELDFSSMTDVLALAHQAGADRIGMLTPGVEALP